MGQHHGRPRADPADERGRGEDADGEPAHGLAYKLLLSPSGTKFGKSEAGDSVWLDPARTTPYAFYQYWLNTDDRDVGHVPALVHELPREEIEALEAEVARRARGARRRSGRWRATSRPGPTARRRPRTAIARLGGDVLGGADRGPGRRCASLFASTGGFTFDPASAGAGRGGAARPRPGVFASHGEARRLIAGGGVTDQRRRGSRIPASVPEPIAGEWLDVRIGKRRREIGRRAG